jgi:hypothetical protein
MLRRCGAEWRKIVYRNHARRTALAQRRCQALCRSRIESTQRLVGDEQIGRCDNGNERRRRRSFTAAKGAQAAIGQSNVNGDVARRSLNARAHLFRGNLSRLEWERRIISKERQCIRGGGARRHVAESLTQHPWNPRLRCGGGDQVNSSNHELPLQFAWEHGAEQSSDRPQEGALPSARCPTDEEQPASWKADRCSAQVEREPI